ncbi:MAG TPA: hypothetical protein P5205_14625 [Candidatus Paceibacterota bacterium]|nr:hypothetical protein [Verrucomicrobiota bacterium]HSA11597.1 hypothetical protein [Candidatus Paceibacterota bacterium]
MNARTAHRSLRRVLPQVTPQEVAELLLREQKRKQAKAEQGRLLGQISDLLFRLDPEGIYLSGRGAYENEAGEIALELRHCRTASDVQALVERVFCEQFGPAEPGKYQGLATELRKEVTRPAF